MKLNLVLAMSLALSVGSSAWAAEFSVMGGKPGNGTPGNSQGISYAQFVEQCANPNGSAIQREPQNIKLQCTDIRSEWVAAAPGEVPLPGVRKVVTAIFSDKFHVGAVAREVPVFNKSGSCLRFKEVERTLTIERPLSCAEVLGMKGTPEDFCLSALDAAKGANPKLTDVRDTGNVINTCDGMNGGGNGKTGGK